MSLGAALVAALALLLYLRSPVDLVPDRLGALGLLDDALLLVVGIWWLARRIRARRPPRQDEAPAWDPWRILGVPPGASADEVARAYREGVKQYHPDRVAHLGEELQRVAHRRTLELQRAYAELRGS
jgi:DnaJ-domain-containing protein 1